MKNFNNEYRWAVKDSVFKHLFKIKEYSLKLYKTLMPLDESITENDIDIVTCETVLMNGLYNDLGLLVRNTILFLMEAQSTWSINILIRDFLYLALSYKEYIEKNQIDLYGSKKIFIPIPKLYVLYTGDKKLEKEEISLKEEYFNNEGCIDLKIKILTKENLSKLSATQENNIISQYVAFTEISDEFVKKYGRSKKTAKMVINECISKNILRSFMQEHREEVENMELLFDPEVYGRIHDASVAREAREEGMQKGMEQGMQKGIKQGIQQGMIDLLIRQFNDKKISAKEGADYLGITAQEFLDLVK